MKYDFTEVEFGMPLRPLVEARAILASHPKVEKAIIHGERVLGTHHSGTRMELTLHGDQLETGDLWCIAYDFEESSLPYLADITLFAHLTDSNLKQHIERYGQVFYDKNINYQKTAA